MKIEILYFDGCPNHKPAIELVHQVLREQAVSAEVVEVNIADAATAESARFVGSPSIRIDGMDVEPAARTAREYALSCRTYTTNGRIGGLPSKDVIRQALKDTSNHLVDRVPLPTSRAGCEPDPSDYHRIPGSISHSVMMAGSVIAAIGASLCCTLPIIFALSGFSILGAAAYFNTLRPYLLIVTFGLLGVAFYSAYRPLPQSACADTACSVPLNRRPTRIILWLVTALVVVVATFPYYSGLIAELLLDSGS
jgi:hypothetical protein